MAHVSGATVAPAAETKTSTSPLPDRQHVLRLITEVLLIVVILAAIFTTGFLLFKDKIIEETRSVFTPDDGSSGGGKKPDETTSAPGSGGPGQSGEDKEQSPFMRVVRLLGLIVISIYVVIGVAWASMRSRLTTFGEVTSRSTTSGMMGEAKQRVAGLVRHTEHLSEVLVGMTPGIIIMILSVVLTSFDLNVAGNYLLISGALLTIVFGFFGVLFYTKLWSRTRGRFMTRAIAMSAPIVIFIAMGFIAMGTKGAEGLVGVSFSFAVVWFLLVMFLFYITYYTKHTTGADGQEEDLGNKLMRDFEKRKMYVNAYGRYKKGGLPALLRYLVDEWVAAERSPDSSQEQQQQQQQQQGQQQGQQGQQGQQQKQPDPPAQQGWFDYFKDTATGAATAATGAAKAAADAAANAGEGVRNVLYGATDPDAASDPGKGENDDGQTGPDAF